MFTQARIRVYLSFTLAFFVLFLLVSLFFVDIPKENKDLVNILLGAVLGWISGVVNFYFGNNKKDKDDD